MDNSIANAEKEVLVEIVKLTQKRGLVGSKGGWKDFLSTYDRKFGSSLSDPAKRPVETLVDFLKTFSKEEDLKFFARSLQYHANRKLVEGFKTKSDGKDSLEMRLVRLTLEHPEYPLDYSFPSYEEGWMVIKLRSNFKNPTALLAVDCEMVLCEDGTEGLVRVCVVDRNLEVKLNKFVKPHKPVVDYRTGITGVDAGDLSEITTSLADIQKSMKKLLAHGAILVGHSLHNDLRALKLDYPRVIDTAFIFRFENQPLNRRPSLNNLCESVLGYQVRVKGAVHNCLDDASAAMRLALAKLDRGLDDPIPIVHEDVSENEMAKLLLHRIPKNVPIEELCRIIPGECTMELQPKKKGGGKYHAVLAIFRNSEEASEAFDNVQGTEGRDSYGRLQKDVSFQLSTGATSSLMIRKMSLVDSLDQLSSKKRSSDVEKISGDSKKLKTDAKTEDKVLNEVSRDSKKLKRDAKTEDKAMKEISGDSSKLKMDAKTKDKVMKVDTRQSEEHMKEIQRLKELLSARDHEISSLHKIITALTRKQGL